MGPDPKVAFNISVDMQDLISLPTLRSDFWTQEGAKIAEATFLDEDFRLQKDITVNVVPLSVIYGPGKTIVASYNGRLINYRTEDFSFMRNFDYGRFTGDFDLTHNDTFRDIRDVKDKT